MNQQIEQLRAKMQSGVAAFIYTKVDGTTRVAYGTLKKENIPNPLLDRLVAAINKEDVTIEEVRAFLDKPTKEKVANENVFSYFDLESSGWRSFKVENFVRIV